MKITFDVLKWTIKMDYAVFLLNDTDVNECDVENGQCQISCQNTIGSYRCECPPGLRLRIDKRTCEGK